MADKEKTSYKKYSKEDQKLLAIWAADCAERVLHFFEEARPGDVRPRAALDECRKWVRTGEFKMSVIRGASLAAHAAAREVEQNSPASQAAHAAGQAVATAHVTQHAYGSAYYALKAVIASDPANAEVLAVKEHEWQAAHLSNHLRTEIMNRLQLAKGKKGLVVKIHKGQGF